ncbi:MAG TPA: hypothetical protein VG076_08275, partial [Acidimicrobiales bacterium]|nr:hypothetical protein [Acidimicrobiales bacterium]
VSLSGNHGVVTVSGNTGTCSAPGGTCRIRGSLTLSQNTGPNTVTNNDIAGNLNCFGNGSTVSGGNTAPAKNGQCPT